MNFLKAFDFHVAFLGIAFFLLGSSWVKAQQEIVSLNPNKALTQYNLDSWDVDKGMPSNLVLDNLLSEDGYMWFATFEGLIKFDGLTFDIFNERTNTQFNTSGVLSLYEDEDGIIWMGTNAGGLMRKTGEVFNTYMHPENQQRNIISDICRDKKGNLWLATREGVQKFKDGKFIDEKALDILSQVTITSILADSEDNIWIGTIGEGLFRYQNNEVIRYTTEDGLNHNTVRALFEDRDNNLWVGTNDGVCKMESGSVGELFVRITKTTDLINEIKEDSHGAIWIATSQGLVRFYNDREDVLGLEDGLSDGRVQTLAFDNEGSLWLGTYRGGINRLKDGKFRNFGLKEGLPHEIVNVAYYDREGNIWIGTEKGLVLLKNDPLEIISFDSPLHHVRIRDVLQDTRGHVWVCTYSGLFELNKNKIVKHHSPANGLSNDKVRVAMETSDGMLWIGTGKGLNSYSNGKFVNYGKDDGLNNEFIMSIFEDHKKQIWVGTDGGGLHLLENNSFRNFTKKDGLASDLIFQITEDSEGNLWIGTNGGLTKYDGETFKSITYRKGLYSNSIFQVLIDPYGDFWLSTNKGVQFVKSEVLNSVIDGKQDEITNSITYNHSEGMRSSVITGASMGDITEKGELLIPTIKGMTIIDPDNIPVNKVPPPVRITDIQLNNKSVGTNENIVIPAGKNSLEIHYTGLSLYAPDEVRFKYKLEGFDEEWVDVGSRRVAYFTNLSPGDYTFKVIAANNDGIWNNAGTNIGLVKRAHFYETRTFYVLSLIFAVIIAFLINGIRLRNLRLKSEALELIIQDRIADIEKQSKEIEGQKERLAEINAIKDKLFSIISHDLRGPLNSFSMILKFMSSGNLRESELQQVSSDIEGEVTRLKSLLENLLTWAKKQMHGIQIEPVSIDLQTATNDIILLFEAEAEAKNIHLKNTVCENIKVLADLNMINLVFRNLINNAIKFTRMDGEVIISAKETQEDFIEVSVADNGVGMSQNSLTKLFNSDNSFSMLGTSKEAGFGLGLILCKEFVEENGGKIWVESTENVGTTFRFLLPKSKEKQLISQDS
ncbi:two-component regulator propeller domain-containing protein [Fulvivirgaceae bacterium BMA10]|uniref:histidine kinase n=1 Tax=Splendidivirga corallicola TaxID=3051826 RepID=A0ABT8KTR2_9BACT|nr:two-component regulator propeller domain-containing protein [Fulvivirgaceae bacterium BMA10]